MKVKFVNIINRVFYLINQKRMLLLFGLVILVLSILNSLHAQYPDEFDNILGGYFITQGKLLYLSYFTHHGPIAYFYAAIISLLSGPSFVNFRIILSLANFLLGSLFAYYINKKFGTFYLRLTLIIWTIITLSATYWWAHMLLSDSLAAFLLLGVFINLVFTYFNNLKFNYKDLFLNSFLLSFAVLTSLTYTYVAVILYLSILYWLFKNPIKDNLSWLKIIGIFALPFLIFTIYLLLTGSVNEYYYQSIYYNKKYYVKLTDGSELNNPIRHMIIIFSDFIDRYRALLASVKDLNLGNPLNTTLALANTTLIIYLLIIKRIKLAIFMFLVLVYLTTRADPFQSKETDYQSLPYDYFSIFNSLFVIVLLNDYLKKTLSYTAKLVLSSLYLLLVLLCFFSIWFLFNKSFEKLYAKFMGTQPLIYDRPAIAGNLNKILSPDDYYYIGPFDFEEHLYMKAKPPSRYLIALPGMDHSEKIKLEILEDLKINRPKVIVFNIDDKIYSQDPGRFILDYIKDEYFTLDSLNYPDKTIDIHQNSFGNQQKYSLSRHFFFDKNKKDEILETLIKEGWISKI